MREGMDVAEKRETAMLEFEKVARISILRCLKLVRASSTLFSMLRLAGMGVSMEVCYRNFGSCL